MRLVLVTKAPMYYQVPLYRLLAESVGIDFTVIFVSSAGLRPHDAGYGSLITWDQDLLAGYHSVFLKGASRSELGEGWRAEWDPSILRTLWRLQPDVVWIHGYNSPVVLMAALWTLVTRRRLLIREEQNLLNRRGLWKELLKATLLPRLFSRADAIAIGTRNADWFRRYAAGSVTVAPYAVEGQRLGGVTDQASARASLGVPANSTVVLSVCRFIRKKRLDILLRAFASSRGVGDVLLLVGSGPEEAALRKLAAALNIEAAVVFAGFMNQSDIATAYAAADIFALVSDHDETWGLVVNEAMSCGLPCVVSTSVGCQPDLLPAVASGGIAVPAGDIASTSKALRALLSRSDLRLKLADQARRNVEAWTHDAAAEAIHDLVLGRASPVKQA